MARGSSDVVSRLSPSASSSRSSIAPREPTVEARQFARAMELTPTVAEILLRQGHVEVERTKRFLEPKLAHLTAPDAMLDRAAVAERLRRGLEASERIVVFGDYDCDGITSAAILSLVLESLGGNVKVELASRFEGGYGLSARALERVLAHEPQLVVTCDCGSSDHESLTELRRRGIDSVVIDHHLVPDVPLPALAFLNPHRPECPFEYKGLASCGLVLSVAGELRRITGAKFDLRDYLDLVAIGTIADVAPLTLDNRALVRAGLSLLERTERPGLRALMRRARFVEGAPISAEDVAFRIAPRLNAPGRMGSALPALRLLVEKNESHAEALADQVESLQLARRAAQESIVAQAEQDIAAKGYQDEAAIVIGRADWNPGIVGIVAGKLAERFGCPVVVYGADGDVGRGSVRGPEGSSLFELVSAASHCLIRFGGHHAAAGLEVELRRVAEFREAFIEAARSRHTGASSAGASSPELELLLLDESDDPLRVARELRLLEPCGAGNPAPLLGIAGRLLSAKEVRGGHLRIELTRAKGGSIGGFGPGLGQLASSLGAQLLLVGSLRTSSYQGRERAELLVSRVVPWESSGAARPAQAVTCAMEEP